MKTVPAVLLAISVPYGAYGQAAQRRSLDLTELRLPPGFEIEILARGLSGPRFLAFSQTGVLFVSETGAGRIRVILEGGRLEIFASGLRQPHGLAFRGQDLYVAENHRIAVFRNATNPSLRGGTPEMIAELPGGGGHSTRSIAWTPEGRLLATAGSSCNVCTEADARRATAMRFNADGSGMEIFARGLRNSVGLAVHPQTGEAWATDNGRDNLGDDQPPEEINILRAGGDYGWPRCWGRQQRDPGYSGDCSSTAAPELEMQAHSAPLGIGFYTGEMFPARYQHDAFVAFHGSWNRNQPTGYQVIRVLASSGRAAGQEDFLAGFLRGNTTSGRPVEAITGPDGALYVSDDLNGVVYRIRYVGPRLSPGGAVSAAATAAGVAPGGLVSLYGANLKSQAAQAGSLPLPLGLDDVTVTIGGVRAPLLYAGPRQANFQAPFGLQGRVTLELTNGVTTDSLEVEVRPTAPAIFTVDQSGSGLGAIRAAAQSLEIYCAGLGEVTPAVPAGAAAPASPLARVIAPVRVTVDGAEAEVYFAGLAPNFAGLYQVNVAVPPAARRGLRVPVVVTAGGVPSNVVEAILP